MPGRPKPRIIAAVPVLVSDDVDAARALAGNQLSFYETIPSYQKVIAREGVTSAADLAAIGPAESVAGQLRSYLDAVRRTSCSARWTARTSRPSTSSRP
jgi:hypothetical protein